MQDNVILGVKVQCTPLPFKHAQPMIPTITEILSIAARDLYQLSLSDGKLDPKADVMDPQTVAKLLPAFSNLAAHLDGKLERLAPRILATTRVAVRSTAGEDLEWHDLVKPNDYEHVFDLHPELFLPLVVWAGRVTFGRFFPASALKGSKPKG